MYNQETPEPTIHKLDIKDWKDFMVGTFKKNDTTIEDSIGNTVDRLVKISPKIKKSSKMLFLSGGNAFVPVYLASKFGCKMTIMTEHKEVAKEMEKLAKKYELDEKKIDVLVDDYTMSSFTHETFDMIWSVGAINMKEDMLLIMKEAKRLLVPQGRVVLCELSKVGDQADAELDNYALHSIDDIMHHANKADLEKVYEKPLHKESTAHYNYLIDALAKSEKTAKKALGSKPYDEAVQAVQLLASKAAEEQVAWSFLQFQKRNA